MAPGFGLGAAVLPAPGNARGNRRSSKAIPAQRANLSAKERLARWAEIVFLSRPLRRA